MKNFLLSTLTILLMALLWELLAFKQIVDVQFFPPPHLFIAKMFELLKGDFFHNDLCNSLWRFFLASLISIPLACFLGLEAGASKIADRIINPFLALTYPLPKVAIFPLILLIFGLGDSSKVILIAIGMFYLIYINVRNGTKRILTSPLMDIVHVYKISGWNYYYHFLLKGIFRDFLVGLKAALGYGLLLVVVSEFSVSKNGIGHFIWQAWDQFRIIDMYAGVLILCLLGLCFSYVLDTIIDKWTRT
ncbi:ABC transporter permease subunit [Bacteriovorax stolpii]|uniref:Taurine ABC transporter permease n=1 Tax=Bacteriovorax stolpii TaxID=960 RepID=A0A2K9NX54_BACTC|nr:ABC transporter permease subunit [Bacteriovorax stolpii]AUO00083.1 taurine ABC transporter permease [Bacteriovorax stolpii]QDK39925.1 ABC transporter permease subunit [Bacteriovorax stolpii]TDP54024.1 NitT/TauT family transport system permease protein [Bacteriovorax stolpii]